MACFRGRLLLPGLACLWLGLSFCGEGGGGEGDGLSDVAAETGQCAPDCPLPHGMKCIAIPAGTFIMGCSPDDTLCQEDELPSHSVTLSPFEMLETEVTQAQYQEIVGTEPSCNYGGGGGPDHPVECVWWVDATLFCEKVGGRLPTEAEWEYAARAGTTTAYSCGSTLDCLEEISWFFDSSDGRKHAVRGKQPNAFGLYDMLGNVGEWVGDYYSASFYAQSPATDPAGPASGTYRAYRGGSFNDVYGQLRVSARNVFDPSYLSASFTGFRCVRQPSL